jgi:hypothetical protein
MVQQLRLGQELRLGQSLRLGQIRTLVGHELIVGRLGYARVDRSLGAQSMIFGM